MDLLYDHTGLEENAVLSALTINHGPQCIPALNLPVCVYHQLRALTPQPPPPATYIAPSVTKYS